jgi:hypothetical protein
MSRKRKLSNKIEKLGIHLGGEADFLELHFLCEKCKKSVFKRLLEFNKEFTLEEAYGSRKN